MDTPCVAMFFRASLVFVLSCSFLLSPTISSADWFYYFFEINCDPKEDFFEIREFGLYNEEGEELMQRLTGKLNPPFPNGTYYTLGLTVRDKRGEVVNVKTFRKTCRLRSGTFIAEISPSDIPSATGMCRGGESSLRLTLRRKTSFLAKDLIFNPLCHQGGTVIHSILISGATRDIRVSASFHTDISLERFPFSKSFPLKDFSPITHDSLLRDNPSIRLLQAIVTDQADRFQLLIEQGADVNWADSTGQSLLMTSAKRWNAGLVELLVKSGAKVNAVDHEGRTALAWALHTPPSMQETVMPDQARTLRTLLQHGADLNSRDKGGKSLLTLAAETENQALVDFLRELGAK